LRNLGGAVGSTHLPNNCTNLQRIDSEVLPTVGEKSEIELGLV
jgi:hypothetical protein